MNKKQLEFVMDKLGFVLNRRVAMKLMFLSGGTGYQVEATKLIPKGTATRDAKKCRDKWKECLAIHKAVGELLEGE